MENETKPPIGILPEILFEEGRIFDLIDTIYRHSDIRTENWPKICEWLDELRRRLNRRNSIIHQDD